MAWFRKNVEEEYQAYKNRMLQETPEIIWDKCSEIYFYSCVYEYCMYNDAISYWVAKALGECKNIIAGCWELYLKNEELSIISWADIDELIERYLQHLQIGGRDYEHYAVC